MSNDPRPLELAEYVLSRIEHDMAASPVALAKATDQAISLQATLDSTQLLANSLQRRLLNACTVIDVLIHELNAAGIDVDPMRVIRDRPGGDATLGRN